MLLLGLVGVLVLIVGGFGVVALFCGYCGVWLFVGGGFDVSRAGLRYFGWLWFVCVVLPLYVLVVFGYCVL